ncbi:fibrobacter succinogenes major paralogous domain-containing protein [Litoribacter populi]|uniref:fibrobacter succinogenes major paralogous domain-containing protein n=1 Tax=Litoribacter populi TaxID=2598460 RepID=UPI00117E1C33|nr:fibrobacter succinogenes major paralogous domain-containing protein [Litoribacter populi]
MRQILLYILIFIGLASCQKFDNEQNHQGVVNFSGLNLGEFSNLNANARSLATSTWEHIYQEEVEVVISRQGSGDTYVVNINPNDLSSAEQIELPYGDYQYAIQVNGGAMEDFLPFVAEGNFEVAADMTNIVIDASTDYGLVTVRNDLVEAASINGTGLAMTEDEAYYYKYIKEGGNLSLSINSTAEEQFEESLLIEAYQHFHYFLQMQDESNVSFIEFIIGEFEYVEIPIGGSGEFVNKVIDASDNIYRTVQIGSQTWMAENLRTTKFCNGEEIPNVEGGGAWESLEEAAWTYYDNDQNYNSLFGKLYSRYVVDDPRNICPCGWRVPDNADWEELQEYLGGAAEAGGKLKAAGFNYWRSPNMGANDETRFTAYPGGAFVYASESGNLMNGQSVSEGANFSFLYSLGIWWSSSVNEGQGNAMKLNHANSAANLQALQTQQAALSIRCVKND